MSRVNRIPALVAVAVAIVGLAACGGGGSSEIVARVAGVGSVSRASLEHWMPVEAVVLYQEYPKEPVPKGVIPDPPIYTACIAYSKSAPQQPVASGPKPTTAQLKSKCALKYRELKELTLNTLIAWYWTIAAGKALGMSASGAEVRQRFQEVNNRAFPKPGEFARYLKLTGQNVSDMLFRYRVQAFEAKLIDKLTALKTLKGLTSQERRAALVQFNENLPPNKQWAARTTCRKGYIVSACKEYRGSQPPAIPN
jgi:foldase protein PrsA